MAKATRKSIRPQPMGYSDTPLREKLGIKDGSRVWALGAPPEFPRAVGVLPAGARLVARGKGPFDIAIAFTRSRAELTRRFASACGSLDAGGRLWIAWPKKSAGLGTELTEDVIRAHGLPTGWVDYKVCAIDAVWSGLCFGRRRV